jgi:hypothetical protein
MVSAFVGKLRTGHIDEQTLNELRRRFYHDRSGEFSDHAPDTSRYQDAIQWIARHVLRSRLRTLDALQLAVAFALSQRGLIDQFVCAD